MKITKDMLDTLKKGTGYSIKPQDIKIDKDLNPRLDYGDTDTDEWNSFKNSIKDYGVQQSLKVYFDAEKQEFHLVHGFRRMKAINELLASGEQDDIANIEYVNVDIVEDDKANAIIGHFTLNSGKPLNDVEMAEGLKRLKLQTGEENVAELARRVGLPLTKAHSLLKFAENVGAKVKNAVAKGEISFSAGKALVNKGGSIRDQNRLLDEHKQTGTKITASKIDETKVSLDTKIGNFLAEASKVDDINKEALNMFMAVIAAIRENKSYEDIFPILNIQPVEAA